MGNHSSQETTSSGLATASLVLSIIGICLSFIPIINNVSFFLGIIAIIFAIIELIKKVGKGKAIAGLIIGILAIVITMNLQSTWSKALNETTKNLSKASGSSTDEILKDDLDVTIGNFEMTKETYSTTTSLPVTLKNKSSSSQSFNVQIEAIYSNGTRILTDNVYASNLSANQTQNFKAFQFVESDKLNELKNATFRIVEISMY